MTPTLHLDRSSAARLVFERDGRPVPMEEVFTTGFVAAREESSK